MRTDRDRCRRAAGPALGVGLAALALALGACTAAPEATPQPGPAAGSSATGGTAAKEVLAAPLTSADRLAAAKTAAVAFFQAQATNDTDAARAVSSGPAALTVEWARAVNTNRAANDTPYQMPSIGSPNARVQIDSLDGIDGRWRAKGFVELSLRPGTVASSTSLTSPATPGTTLVSGTPSTSTFLTDLVFTEEDGVVRLDDYRMDDVPYPVSQLFQSLGDAQNGTSSVAVTLSIQRRNLDGTVQFVGTTRNDSDQELQPATATFAPSAPAPVSNGVVFAEPVPAGSARPLLIVIPGAFPGTSGTLHLGFEPYRTTGTAPATAPGTTIVVPGLEWRIPAFPALVPSPVNTIREAQATASTSSSSSSTTASTASSTTTIPVATTVPSTPTTTSSSTTSSTEPSTTTSSSSTLPSTTTTVTTPSSTGP